MTTNFVLNIETKWGSQCWPFIFASYFFTEWILSLQNSQYITLYNVTGMQICMCGFLLTSCFGQRKYNKVGKDISRIKMQKCVLSKWSAESPVKLGHSWFILPSLLQPSWNLLPWQNEIWDLIDLPDLPALDHLFVILVMMTG